MSTAHLNHTIEITQAVVSNYYEFYSFHKLLTTFSKLVVGHFLLNKLVVGFCVVYKTSLLHVHYLHLMAERETARSRGFSQTFCRVCTHPAMKSATVVTSRAYIREKNNTLLDDLVPYLITNRQKM